MYFLVKVKVNRFLNLLYPARKARRRAELRAMCEQMLDVLDKLPKAPREK